MAATPNEPVSKPTLAAGAAVAERTAPSVHPPVLCVEVRQKDSLLANFVRVGVLRQIR